MSSSPIDVLARAAGGLLSSGAAAIGVLGRRVKPLHPEGVLHRATLTRFGSPVPTGMAWLDETGRDEALVRVSRAVGLPAPLPDIHGLAIRVAPEGTPSDVLLAGTGLGLLSRYLLLPSRTPTGHPLTTLLPYRSPRGPLLLGVVPESERRFGLCWAAPLGPWTFFATLELGESLGDDTRVSFDPVVQPLPGTRQYAWVSRLREPAYRTARRRSHRSTGTGSVGTAAHP